MFAQDDQEQDENKDIKVKLLDDLIEKIMSLPDEESKEEEALESPLEESQEGQDQLDPLKKLSQLKA